MLLAELQEQIRNLVVRQDDASRRIAGHGGHDPPQAGSPCTSATSGESGERDHRLFRHSVADWCRQARTGAREFVTSIHRPHRASQRGNNSSLRFWPDGPATAAPTRATGVCPHSTGNWVASVCIDISTRQPELARVGEQLLDARVTLQQGLYLTRATCGVDELMQMHSLGFYSRTSGTPAPGRRAAAAGARRVTFRFVDCRSAPNSPGPRRGQHAGRRRGPCRQKPTAFQAPPQLLRRSSRTAHHHITIEQEGPPGVTTAAASPTMRRPLARSMPVRGNWLMCRCRSSLLISPSRHRGRSSSRGRVAESGRGRLTLLLFRDEYKVPLIDPALLAKMATFNELDVRHCFCSVWRHGSPPAVLRDDRRHQPSIGRVDRPPAVGVGLMLLAHAGRRRPLARLPGFGRWWQRRTRAFVPRQSRGGTRCSAHPANVRSMFAAGMLLWLDVHRRRRLQVSTGIVPRNRGIRRPDATHRQCGQHDDVLAGWLR